MKLVVELRRDELESQAAEVGAGHLGSISSGERGL
jgi:hypothetical protein